MKIKLKKIKLPTGEELAYREREGGKTLLIMVHGNMSSSLHWQPLMEALDEKYRLYAVDLRGFGESTYHNPIESLRDFSRDLKYFADAMNIKGFHLLGWSTGGGVVMQFAADYPDYVEKLILLESVGTRGYPIFRKGEKGQPIPGELLTTREEIARDPVQVLPVLKAYQDRDKQLMKMIWNNLIYTDNQPPEDEYDQYLEEMFKQRNLVDVDYALATFNISSEHNGVRAGSGRAAEITAPTLILWGKNDRVVPEKMALDIKNDLGDNARLVYLDGCGHSPLTDDPEQLLDEITAFLEA